MNASTSKPKIDAVRAKQPTLGALGRLLPEPLLLVTIAGIIVEANAAAGRVMGRKRERLAGESLEGLLGPVSRDDLRHFLRQCAGRGGFIPGPLRVKSHDDNQVYGVEGAAFGSSGGHVVLRLPPRESKLGPFRLLTEKVEELAGEVNSRRRAESLLDHQRRVLEMIATTAPLDQVLQELARLAERHGSSRLLASILVLDENGTHLRHAAAPSLPEAYNAAIDGIEIGPDVGSCGRAAYLNKTVITPDIAHDPNWAEFRELALSHELHTCWSTPIRYRDSTPAGTFALYYRQVTEPSAEDRRIIQIASRMAAVALERRREEVQIERLLARERMARGEAESANRAKDEFLALISHELRNPLNAMLGWTRLLQTDGLDAETTRLGVKTIERNAELQSHLITDILDFSRISSNRLKLKLRPASIADIVEEAMDSVRPDAESTRLHLELRRDDDIPNALWDSARLHQAMVNLLNNAIKFTPAEGRITTSIAGMSSGVRITVTDTGRGIDPAFLSAIFEPFRQGDGSLARNHSGLGLGLAVVRSIVELHGGQVTAHSEGQGRGASFVIELPVTAAGAAIGAEDRPSDPIDVSSLRVLVVDDEPDARELLATALRLNGAHPIVAGSAEQAIALLDAHDGADDSPGFDVLVSDIAMPGADGYALMQAIRARTDNFATLPAAAVSAHAREIDRTAAFAAGFDRHLAKPVEPEDLLTVVSQLAARGASAS